MDREYNSESAINLSRSQRPSAATTPLNTASPIHQENDEPEVSVVFVFFLKHCFSNYRSILSMLFFYLQNTFTFTQQTSVNCSS